MPAILIDTNVLIYANDGRAPARQARALEVLEHLSVIGSGCLSVQCLSEFIAVSTRRLQPPVPIAQALSLAESLAAAFRIFDVTTMIVLEAARGVRDHRLAYYDAQLWASARLNQIAVIFSEDFRPGTTLESVRFVDPFAAGFLLDDWV